MLNYVAGKEESVKSEDVAIEENVSWVDRILLHRPSKVIIVFLMLSVVIPFLLYKFLISNILNELPSDSYSIGSCLVPDTSRLLCGKGDVTQDECHPQCCYDLENHICFHRLPSRFSYLTDQAWNENVTLSPRIPTTPFNNQASKPQIRISVDELTSTHLSITLYDSEKYTVNYGNKLANKEYNYFVNNPEVNIEVTANQGVIFDTNRGPMIASDDIFEITFRLTDESMYGFGEIPMGDSSRILYNHKGGITSIPLIYAKYNGSYHGFLLDVIGPTELYVSGDSLVVRALTNNYLKFHLFVGPTPKDVMADVMNLIGQPDDFEYWMLGAHVCNYHPGDIDDSYANLTTFLTTATSLALPYESHCGTRPIVFNTNCDDREEEIQYIAMGENDLVNLGIRYVPHLSPHVQDLHSLSTLCQDTEFYNKIFLQTSEGNIYSGYIDTEDVFYPNYSNMTTEDFANLWIYNTTFSGMFLVNSWPLDERVKDGNADNLPYFNKYFEAAFNVTPPLETNFPNTTDLYYKNHNNYGNEFYKTVAQFTGDIPIWLTSPQMDGNIMVNRQNVDATWANLNKELVEAALGGISGHWLWSTPICGDTENFNITTQTDLCLSWYHIATFMPMIKIDSFEYERHPAAFQGTTQTYMMNALNNRLSLLPYFNTVLKTGPLLRPMFFEFPDTEELQDLNSQFCVGDDLLVVPNLLPSQNSVNVWMPPGSWFELWSGLSLGVDEGSTVSMATTEADILTLIRGGSIIAYQSNVSTTAEATRKSSNFRLIVALECVDLTTLDPQLCVADGSLYLSENLSITFSSNDTTLIISSTGTDFSSVCDETSVWSNIISEVNIYGLDEDDNNYDNKLNVETNIDLCELETSEVSLVFLEK